MYPGFHRHHHHHPIKLVRWCPLTWWQRRWSMKSIKLLYLRLKWVD